MRNSKPSRRSPRDLAAPEYQRVPNLDAMSKDELMNFWSKYHRPSRKSAAMLIGDTRPHYTTITADLAHYASNKAAALSCQAKRDALGTGVYEHICRQIYDRLPADLKWR